MKITREQDLRRENGGVGRSREKTAWKVRMNNYLIKALSH